LILSLLGAPSMGLGELASSTSASGSALSGSTSTKYAIPLQKLKEVVSEKLKTGTGDGGVGIGSGFGEKDVTRALYGCVAKKLMAIDRGGGGQVVRFNL